MANKHTKSVLNAICMPQSARSEFYVVEDAADYRDLAYFAQLL